MSDSGVWSLQRRLVFRLALLWGLALLIAASVVVWVSWRAEQFRRAGEANIAAAALERVAIRLGAAAFVEEVDRDGGEVELEGLLESLFERELEGERIEESAITLVRAAPISEPLEGAIERAAMEQRPRYARRWLFDAIVDGQPVDGAGRRATIGDLDFDIVVARARGSSSTWLSATLIEDVAPIFVPLAFLSIVIVAWTTQRGLAPVRALSRQAAALQIEQRPEPLDAAAAPEEILPLTQSFDLAMARAHRVFERQRRFTANAAHELRTPLAVLRARIDAMAPGCERAALTRDVERMTRLVEQLLASARLEARPPATLKPIDLRDVAIEVAADVAPMFLREGKSVELAGELAPVYAMAEADLLAQALRNLLDNARRHSPKGGCVRVLVEKPARLVVEDQGPGLPPGDPKELFEPFASKGPAPGAAGLGLAIVAETMRLLEGAARAADRPEGGARFSLEFAAVSPRKRVEPQAASRSS